MKRALFVQLFGLLGLVLLQGCASQVVTSKSGSRKHRRAVVTYYCGAEDRRWRNRVASGGRAKIGTAAAETTVAFGTWIKIPQLMRYFKTEWFQVRDRGSAVEKRTAAKKQGLMDVPVIDIWTPNRYVMNRLSKTMPPVMEVDGL